jgi:hypothetical protein
MSNHSQLNDDDDDDDNNNNNNNIVVTGRQFTFLQLCKHTQRDRMLKA